VAEHWAVNASPLIVLAHIGQQDLLPALADQVVVPDAVATADAVATEIQAGPAQDAARQVLAAGRFTVVGTPPPPPELLSWDLGSGETAVLSLALADKQWTPILDDAAARKCARSFDLPLKGTLAIVLMAKQRNLIPSAAQIIQSLVAVGFRLDDRLIQETLARTVGETWPPPT
jgi:predicted nucleic acid-binding protein